MKGIIMFILIILAAFWKPLDAQQKTDQGNVPTAEEVEKILEALPDRPTVQPKAERNLLVFSISWGYKHSAIPYGKKTFELMAQKSGAFNVVISDDISMFESQHLEQFDAIVFNNTNNEIFLPETIDSLSAEEQKQARQRDQRLKKNLVDFLAGGKGLAVIHAGVASFRKWPEFGQIIGARFDNHPWNAGSKVTLKVEEPEHPLVQAFKSASFEVTDEIYQVKAPYSRENLRVLLRVDTSRTDMELKNIHRTDGDFAISWIKSYGEGRVFYCALGHQHHIFWDSAILQHFLDGIQFVLGDLECDATPSSRMK